MDFCPNCGAMLYPKSVEVGGQVMLYLSCKKCGYASDAEYSKLDCKEFSHGIKQMVTVIDPEAEVSTESTIPIECPRCGNNLGYVWQVQTRSADESSTQFIRCTRCAYTYRETT
jgi:DNA-directed RNA polymerase subunit M